MSDGSLGVGVVFITDVDLCLKSSQATHIPQQYIFPKEEIFMGTPIAYYFMIVYYIWV